MNTINSEKDRLEGLGIDQLELMALFLGILEKVIPKHLSGLKMFRGKIIHLI